MHLFATVRRQEQGAYSDTFAPMIRELFGRRSAIAHGPYYFVRTWDDQGGGEFLNVSISDVENTDAMAEALRGSAQRHGCTADVDETPLGAAPSPLWNTGFAGPEFTGLSQRLYQGAAPIMASFLGFAGDSPVGSSAPALAAIRLMAVHTRATLLGSTQRELPGYSFADLLALRLLSFRSHYEGIYPRTKDPAAFEAACERFYAQAGPAAREIVAACADPDGEPTEDEPARRWGTFTASCAGDIGRRFRAGGLVNAGRRLEDLVRERGKPVEPTRFHTSASSALAYLLHEDPDFQTYRLQTSLLYSCLFTLGFSLAERYVFCYVLARANEEVTGQSTRELQTRLHALAQRVAPGALTRSA